MFTTSAQSNLGRLPNCQEHSLVNKPLKGWLCDAGQFNAKSGSILEPTCRSYGPAHECLRFPLRTACQNDAGGWDDDWISNGCGVKMFHFKILSLITSLLHMTKSFKWLPSERHKYTRRLRKRNSHDRTTITCTTHILGLLSCDCTFRSVATSARARHGSFTFN